MSNLLRSLSLAVIFLISVQAVADTAAALAAARFRYPATDVRSVSVTPLLGVFAFNMGGEIVYGDVSARYLILGRLIDMDSPLSDAVAHSSAAKVDYALIAAGAIELQEGTRGEVIVFSDPQCRYCATLEQRLATGELAGYRVRLVLAPLLPGSQPIARRLLCAPQPSRAYRAYMLGRELPLDCTTDDLPPHLAAMRAAGIVATPSFLTPNGALRAGLLPAGELQAWIASGQQRR